MKQMLLLLLTILTYGLTQGQSKKQIRLARKDSVIKDTIIFDGLTSMPNKNRVYVPYNAWVSITIKNVNPFKSLPNAELVFTNFDLGKTDNIPSLSDLIKSSSNIAAEEEKTDSTKIKNAKTFNNNLASDLFRRNAFSIQMLKDLTEMEKSDSKKEKLAHQKSVDSLNAQIKKQEDSIKIIQNKINLLNAIIEKMMLDQENEKKFKDAYESFVSTINSLSNFLALNIPMFQLFKDQFINKEITNKSIEELLKSRLPGYITGERELISKANDFLKTKFDILLQTFGDASLAYQKINTPSDTDTFKGSGSVKLNNNAVLNISSLELKLMREPKYKEQMAFMNSKKSVIKNDSIKQSIFIYSDTLMSRAERILNDPFEQTIKSFRVDADEIKVTVPLANVEPFTISTTGRLRVDVSTGLFGHFGKSDDKYKSVKDTLNQTYLIKQRNEGINFAIGFLMNVYKYEPRNKINVGGSLGFNFPVNGSSATNNSSIQLVAGISFFTTTVDRLSITIGTSLRKAQRLNKNNLFTSDDGNTYNFKNQNDIEPIYDPAYRIGGFLGISYSLFGNKSKQTQ